MAPGYLLNHIKMPLKEAVWKVLISEMGINVLKITVVAILFLLHAL